jgi:hypothetical protein
MPKIAQELLKNRSLVFFGGAMAVIFGLVIVILHNVWELDWKVIITLIGYLSLLKGIVRLFAPEVDKAVVHGLIDTPAAYIGVLIVLLLIGIFLIYNGFSVHINVG